jgi:spore coat polysaccharide biosynthesis predicted glycosyltransferase SpsG
MTSLLLRVDASPTMGVGHLSRCVALGTAARARGWKVALCGSFTAGEWLVGDLPVVPSLGPADVVVVDHYGLGPVSVPSLVVSIEDGHFGRRDADIVVDANLYSTPRPGSPVTLRGPAYAPLRAEIRAASWRGGSTPPKVVVVMGGGAAPSSVAAAVTALRETGVAVAVQAVSAVPVPGVEVIRPTPALPSLFAEADLVVSAAGVTLLELCCIGVPTALVRIADNQAAGYAAAVDQGLAAGLGTDPRAHVETLRTLLLDAGKRKALAAKARSAVDGRGTERILDAIENKLCGSPVVRAATAADSPLLLAWRNDPGTREWSRTTAPVTPAEHETWLTRTLADPDRRLLIAEHNREPVGTVRFDRDDTGWEVSITLAPEARGHRLAGKVLLAAERTVRPATIRANVHRDNVASLALFRNAGYRRASGDGLLEWLVKQV